MKACLTIFRDRHEYILGRLLANCRTFKIYSSLSWVTFEEIRKYLFMVSSTLKYIIFENRKEWIIQFSFVFNCSMQICIVNHDRFKSFRVSSSPKLFNSLNRNECYILSVRFIKFHKLISYIDLLISCRSKTLQQFHHKFE